MFCQEWVRNLMIRTGVAEPCTRESLHNGCIEELDGIKGSMYSHSLERIRGLWAFCEFDLQSMSSNGKTLTQMLAWHLGCNSNMPNCRLHALIQAMVFRGAFTAPSDNAMVPQHLRSYEQKFNLGSTFDCVYSFLYSTLLEQLIPSLTKIILDMLGLQRS